MIQERISRAVSKFTFELWFSCWAMKAMIGIAIATLSLFSLGRIWLSQNITSLAKILRTPEECSTSGSGLKSWMRLLSMASRNEGWFGARLVFSSLSSESKLDPDFVRKRACTRRRSYFNVYCRRHIVIRFKMFNVASFWYAHHWALIY